MYNENIEEILTEFINTFGVREPIKSDFIAINIKMGRIEEAIKMIVEIFNLPISINIMRVSRDSLNKSRNSPSIFFSFNDLIAQVEIPNNLPLFGSSALNGYPINIKIGHISKSNPNIFIMIMAHEISHILLYSLRHLRKENEIYTDILAILFGFQNIFKKARKIKTTSIEQGLLSSTTTTNTTTYGYLTDIQFNSVLDKIESELIKNRKHKLALQKKIKESQKQILTYKKMISQFKKILAILIKNLKTNISEVDGKRITEFFQPGFIDNVEAPLQNQKKIKLIENFIKDFDHYNSQNINQLSSYSKFLKKLIFDVNNLISSIHKDTKMVSKYIDFKYRLCFLYFPIVKWLKR